jgi:response regulator RpfG family c-di-GMP phosphodiesterase
MSERILCVDDDVNILESHQRVFRKQFQIDSAVGGQQALSLLESKGPYAVVVSDMRMPGMDGAELLSEIRKRSPDTIRILLTGYADVAASIKAVNEGRIFSFLTKPCPPDALGKALEAGLGQHRLLRAEKELLEQTLSGSLKVFTDILGLVKPAAFGRTGRVRRLAHELARQLGVGGDWQIDAAAMLSQVGCVSLPEEVLERVYAGKELTEPEREVFADHPRVGHDLIAAIPRLGPVAEAIAHQDRKYDGSDGDVRGEDIPLAARILKVALDTDSLLSGGATNGEALDALKQRPGWYDPAVVDGLRRVFTTNRYIERLVPVSRLTDDMVFASDVLSASGVLLVSKGQEVSPPVRARLALIVKNNGIPPELRVLVPAR